MGYHEKRHFWDRFLNACFRDFISKFRESLDIFAEFFQPWLGLFWWPFLVLTIRHLWPEAEPGVVMNDLAAEDNELFLCFLSSVFACVAVLRPDKSLPMRCAGGFCRWASRVWSSANQFWAFFCLNMYIGSWWHWYDFVIYKFRYSWNIFPRFCHRKKNTHPHKQLLWFSAPHITKMIIIST